MGDPLRLLLVEESGDDAAQIEATLRWGGFAVESHRVTSLEALRRALREARWDVLVTNYELEGVDGLEVLALAGEEDVELPVILVSERIGEEAAVEAMRAGARDYVDKSSLARLAPAVRRELEEAVSRRQRRIAEAKYAVLFRSSPNPTLLTAAEDGRFLELNEAFERISGYPRQEVLGKTTVELGFWSHGSSRDRFRRALLEDGSIRDMELQVEHKDGRLLDTLVSAEMVELPEGLGILSVVEDITERKRARRALERSEERFSKAFFANPNPAVITTLSDDTILEVNECLCEMTGYRREELLGQSGVALGLWGQEDAVRVGRHLRDRESVRDMEVRSRGRDGTTYELLVSAVTVEMAGEPCVLNVGVDITERNRLQAQLLRAQRLESVGTLAGGIAHDLNNVLTPILMAIKLLRQDRAEERDEILDVLESNARRGADLIRQLLGFARGAGRRRIQVDCERLVLELGGIVRDTFPKSVELELSVEDDLWQVEGDPTQFHQALLNLAVNARDAMDGEGKLSIIARNREVDEGGDEVLRGMPPGRYVELRVADTGPGIPVALRHRVFDPFFTTKDPGHGTGLGLFSVERIVTAHGGFVEIADVREGQGALFVLYLPVTGRRSEETGRRQAVLPSLESDGELVLVVDDEEAVREIAAGVLEAAGYRTLAAADGQEARRLLEEHGSEVRAAVVDLVMPGVDGGATIEALRRLRPDLPVIAISGLDDRIQGTPPPGADLFLGKPFTAEELLAALRRLLRPIETAAVPIAREGS